MNGPVPCEPGTEEQRDRRARQVAGVRKLPSSTGSCESTGPSGRAGGEAMLSDLLHVATAHISLGL